MKKYINLYSRQPKISDCGKCDNSCDTEKDFFELFKSLKERSEKRANSECAIPTSESFDILDSLRCSEFPDRREFKKSEAKELEKAENDFFSALDLNDPSNFYVGIINFASDYGTVMSKYSFREGFVTALRLMNEVSRYE